MSVALERVNTWARSHPFLWAAISFVYLSVILFAVTAGLLDYGVVPAVGFALTFASVFSVATAIINHRRSRP